MPLIFVFRTIMFVVSIAVMVISGLLLWEWFEGDAVRDAAGVVHLVREDWMLWLGLTLLAVSLFGKLLLAALFALSAPQPVTDARRPGVETSVVSPTGSRLFVEVYGTDDRPPLILTHGWGLDSTIWRKAVESLSTRFQVVVWDLPGLGKSKPGSTAGIDLESFAEDLAAVIASVGDRKVVLVGHSIGGMIIQTLARTRPALFTASVAGTVLLNTTHTNPLKTMIAAPLWQALRWPVIEPLLWLTISLLPLSWLAAWQSYLSGTAHLANRLGFGRHARWQDLAHTTLLTTRNSPAVQARGILAMLRWDSGRPLSALDVPALVIGGALDIVTKPEASRTIADTAARAQLKIVEGVNHMGFLEAASAYEKAIAEFALSVQPATGGRPPGGEHIAAPPPG